MGDPMSSTPTTELTPKQVALFAIDKAAKAIAAKDPDGAPAVRERLLVGFSHCILYPKAVLEAFALAWPIVADALNQQPAEAERIARDLQAAVAVTYVAMFKEMQVAVEEAAKMCDMVAQSRKGGSWQTK
jgi:hypothetical protein